MQAAAYECPLTFHELGELGRVNYNWAVADFVAENLLHALQGPHSYDGANRKMYPWMITRKIKHLRKLSKSVQDSEAQSLLLDFCNRVRELTNARNLAVHGVWARETLPNQKYRPSAFSLRNEDPILPQHITELADALAEATIVGNNAHGRLTGLDLDRVTYPVHFYFGCHAPPAA